MAKLGPIVIVDDDKDDCDLCVEAFNRLGVENRITCFENGVAALDYLKTTADQPFIILCDVNMPLMNGLELRRAIEADKQLKEKSIPFVFISTTASRPAVREAYQLSVQGFFTKGSSVSEVMQLFSEIYHYWQRCRHPNN